MVPSLVDINTAALSVALVVAEVAYTGCSSTDLQA